MVKITTCGIMDQGKSGESPRARRARLLDNKDRTRTIGNKTGAWNVKTKRYPATGLVQRQYFQHGHRGHEGGQEWDTSRDDSLPAEERAIRDERNLYRSMKRAKGKVYDLAMANVWMWYLVLTLDPEKVDRYDYDACYKKVVNQLRKMQRHYPNLKYLVVPELHKDGAWHFNVLVRGVPEDAFTYSGRMTYKGKNWKEEDVPEEDRDGCRKIYHVDKYTMGHTTATRIEDTRKTANYVTKYITKDMVAATKGRQKYLRSEGLKLPEVTTELMSDRDQRRVFFENVANMQYQKLVDIDKGEYHEQILYVYYGEMTDEEREEKRRASFERWQKRQRAYRAEIQEQIKRRPPPGCS